MICFQIYHSYLVELTPPRGLGCLDLALIHMALYQISIKCQDRIGGGDARALQGASRRDSYETGPFLYEIPSFLNEITSFLNGITSFLYEITSFLCGKQDSTRSHWQNFTIRRWQLPAEKIDCQFGQIMERTSLRAVNNFTVHSVNHTDHVKGMILLSLKRHSLIYWFT